MNDIGEQVIRCLVGACDESCKYSSSKTLGCDGYEKVAEKAHRLFEKYEEYENLEEQGRLLKLPCAVGTPVYYIQGNCEGVSKEMMFVDRTFFNLDMLSKIGTEFFLTKSEAEEVLKKMKEKRQK